jgi:hypothetical protein
VSRGRARKYRDASASSASWSPTLAARGWGTQGWRPRQKENRGSPSAALSDRLSFARDRFCKLVCWARRETRFSEPMATTMPTRGRRNIACARRAMAIVEVLREWLRLRLAPALDRAHGAAADWAGSARRRNAASPCRSLLRWLLPSGRLAGARESR